MRTGPRPESRNARNRRIADQQAERIGARVAQRGAANGPRFFTNIVSLT